MSWRHDVMVGLRTLAVQQTQQALELQHAKESIALLAEAVRDLEARLDDHVET